MCAGAPGGPLSGYGATPHIDPPPNTRKHTTMKLHRTLTTAALAAVLGLSSAAVFAQAASAPAATPGVDKRQQRQEQRIEQGQASGALTARESRRLEHQQARIERAEDKVKADGSVTAGERKHLHHMQDHANKRIHRQKHDAQTRTGN